MPYFKAVVKGAEFLPEEIFYKQIKYTKQLIKRHEVKP
jgi:hypothetical protein